MLRKLLSVSGFTLLSRITGLIRDLMAAAIMGAGMLADAFFVALRLPNHFRAIFGEGAFNQAFIPSISRLREASGDKAAQHFASSVWTLMIIVQLPLMIIALVGMPWLVSLLAPGFSDQPEKYALAITLTRITFPYLFFITLVTLVSGILNSVDRFAAAAASPILLNIAMVVALAFAALFPTAGHAAAWGVSVAGLLQLLMVLADARIAGVVPRLVRPRLDADMKVFLKALLPAVIGSAGIQIAVFADTIIASQLPTGAVASIYYADRLYQLPVGVIAIAAGTVLLPEMSRRLSIGDEVSAHRAQNRAFIFSLALSAPCLVAFFLLPTAIMSAVFGRGAFTAADAEAAGAVLSAYAIGLPAIVLISSVVASFRSRLDTATPAIVSLSVIAVNVTLKIIFAQRLGAAGLALATAIAAWANVLILYGIALHRGWTAPNSELMRAVLATALACFALAGATLATHHVASPWSAGLPRFNDEILLAVDALIGGIVYAAAILVAFKGLRLSLRRI
ncbi:putative lipid II flippase MurJ [Hyphomicrobiales bacterium]|nr:putative lipid II flippase MurJ [Hyphomicrobiales bacterium]CAH1669955.1 putative lipid II flippase MurJ [Hyphomicrobiales bacterium]